MRTAIIAALAIAPIVATWSGSVCETHGCQIGQEVYDSIQGYVAGGIGGFPGPGSGQCECDPPDCIEVRPCEGEAIYTINAGSDYVCINSNNMGHRTDITLQVTECDDNDQAAAYITSSNTNCSPTISYGLIAYFCYKCTELSCP